MAEKIFKITTHKLGKKSIEFMTKIHKNIIDNEIDSIIIDLQYYEYVHPSFAVIIASFLYLGYFYKKDVKICFNRENAKSIDFLLTSGIVEHFIVNNNADIGTLDIKNRVAFKRFIKLEDTIQTVYEILDKAPVKVSDELKGDLISKISEIFSNAFDHGKSEIGVFGCGYINSSNNFSFSVYDAGIGICTNVNNYLPEKLSPKKAIEWAFKQGNSTLNGKVDFPRGAGLNLLESFIIANDGRIDVVSENVYYKIKNGEKKTKKLKYPLIGTMFSITIRSDKKYIYTY